MDTSIAARWAVWLVALAGMGGSPSRGEDIRQLAMEVFDEDLLDGQAVKTFLENCYQKTPARVFGLDWMP